MNRRARVAGALALAMTLPLPAAGQTSGVGINSHLGTLGLGVDGMVSFGEQLAVRAGINFQPWAVRADYSGVDFDLDLPSPSVMGTVNYYPGGTIFFLSGGFVYFGDDPSLDAVLADSLDLGDGTYAPEDIGNLTGTVDTRSLAPYLGIGLGNMSTGGEWAFFLDLGAAFHGTPEVGLQADGPIAGDPVFQEDLRQEEEEIRDDLSSLKVYPVFSVGFRVRMF